MQGKQVCDWDASMRRQAGGQAGRQAGGPEYAFMCVCVYVCVCVFPSVPSFVDICALQAGDCKTLAPAPPQRTKINRNKNPRKIRIVRRPAAPASGPESWKS